MLGLLDSDLLAYEFGGLKSEEGEVIPLNFAINSMYDRIDTIKERSGVDKLDFYLTGKGNFREKVATIQPYKGTRPSEKPKHWAALRHELKVNLNAEVVDGIEADDIVSILQREDIELSERMFAAYTAEGICEHESAVGYYSTIMLSRDKDLNMVPGWHYGWEAGKCKEKPLWFQDELGGLRLFYKQLLTGDSVDNILGLFGVGAKSTLVSGVDAYDNELDMYLHVLKKYQDRFGSYAEQFLLENGRLLWMLRTEDDVWELPIVTQA